LLCNKNVGTKGKTHTHKHLGINKDEQEKTFSRNIDKHQGLLVKTVGLKDQNQAFEISI